MRVDSIIGDRYKLISCLKQNVAGATYKALDLQNGSSWVAIKIISLQSAEDWKTLKLFQGEVSILSRLDHPHIPKYLNYFEIDTPDNQYYCLVREFIDGISLEELINTNYPLTESSIASIGAKLLSILQYLHQCNPPVIHRDIIPENILRNPDGSIYLIDFSAVTSIRQNTDLFEDTFVGTFGYAPPEQFRGEALPASDLYSLGNVLLFLLEKKHPTESFVKGLDRYSQLKIQVSYQTINWLMKLLSPQIQDRFSSAEEALTALSNLVCLRQSCSWNESLKNEIRRKVLEHSLPKPIALSEVVNDNKKSTLLRHKGNTLWIYLPDANYFQPQRLVVEKTTFILYMGNSLFQHPIKGNKADLSVSLVKKEYGERSVQNICCNIGDGTNFYNFGSELTDWEQSRLVQDIKEFIESS